MNRIEKGLHQYHASTQGSEDPKEAQSHSTQSSAEENGQRSSRTLSDPPFARVNSIAPSSPAEAAGLQVGDKIINFGPVHSGNHDNLRKLAEVVRRNEGVRQSHAVTGFAH